MIVQTEQLTALGVAPDRIYIDRGFSGTSRKNRAGLDQALAAVWDGSIFTVTNRQTEHRHGPSMGVGLAGSLPRKSP